MKLDQFLNNWRRLKTSFPHENHAFERQPIPPGPVTVHDLHRDSETEAGLPLNLPLYLPQISSPAFRRFERGEAHPDGEIRLTPCVTPSDVQLIRQYLSLVEAIPDFLLRGNWLFDDDLIDPDA